MRKEHRIAVIIPALDEADSIAGVVSAQPDWVDTVVVVDNGSNDGTAAQAHGAGSAVIHEARRGYGAACLAGLRAVTAYPIVVFTDGDGSNDPSDMAALVAPLLAGKADLVIGSRVLGNAEQGALGAVQRFGNALSCNLMRLLWRRRFTDLGPYRAVTQEALGRLNMEEPAMGWTIEMQVKALRRGLRVVEVPVACRRRVTGRSKISGSLIGSMRAGTRILYVIFRARLVGG
jgi:glycosyltransferase involved in cell wall biosynthesis